MTLADIKSIEDKLRVLDVDYSEWERTSHKKKSDREPKRVSYAPSHEVDSLKDDTRTLPKLPLKRSPRSEYDYEPQADRPSNRPLLTREACSLLCRHGQKRTYSSQVEKRKPKEGVINLYKIQIKAKQNSLKGYKERYLKLADSNSKLRDEILQFEASKYSDAKSIISRYDKYRSAMGVLESKHEGEIKKVEDDFDEQQLQVQQQLAELEIDLQHVEELLEEEKMALKILLNYKEKEYPEKLQAIDLLKKEIEMLNEDFNERMEDLDGTARRAQEEYIYDAQLKKEDIKKYACREAVDSMNGKEKEIAIRNKILTKEIEFHKAESAKMEFEITTLKAELRLLISEQIDRQEREKYPHLFQEKCLPETEFELRIPYQEWLPI